MLSQLPFQSQRRALIKQDVRDHNIKYHDFLKKHKGSLLLFLMSEEWFECKVVSYTEDTVTVRLAETTEVRTVDLMDVCEFELY